MSLTAFNKKRREQEEINKKKKKARQDKASKLIQKVYEDTNLQALYNKLKGMKKKKLSAICDNLHIEAKKGDDCATLITDEMMIWDPIPTIRQLDTEELLNIEGYSGSNPFETDNVTEDDNNTG